MKLLKKLISILVITAVCMPAVSCSSGAEEAVTYGEVTSVSDVTTVQTTAPSIDAVPEAEVFRNGTDGIDIDITVLSSTMVYSVVYCMIYTPGDYVGMVVKMNGLFDYYYDEYTGNEYYACIIQDATACCSQGLEFVPSEENGYTYPDDFPAIGEEITVVGTFDYYHENGFTYCTLRDATICAD